MEYIVRVGDRAFGQYDDKTKAVKMAQTASNVFIGKACSVTHQNGNRVKGTPVYVSGKEI